MKQEQAQKFIAIAQAERTRIEKLVNTAFSNPDDPRVVKPLITEFMVTQALMVHVLADMNTNLEHIAEELVKANQPMGLMERPQKE